jgi:hypothetical protein
MPNLIRLHGLNFEVLMSLSVLERFWAKVNKNGPLHPDLQSRCWLWMGTKNHQGYGRIYANGLNVSTHRLSWQIHKDPDFAVRTDRYGIHVLHHCDNPSCVNPDHLFTGTNADNIRDRNAKGRMVWRKGEDDPKAKLSNRDVEEIREFHRDRIFRVRQLARMYKVSHSIISRIVNNKYRTGNL